MSCCLPPTSSVRLQKIPGVVNGNRIVRSRKKATRLPDELESALQQLLHVLGMSAGVFEQRREIYEFVVANSVVTYTCCLRGSEDAYHAFFGQCNIVEHMSIDVNAGYEG